MVTPQALSGPPWGTYPSWGKQCHTRSNRCSPYLGKYRPGTRSPYAVLDDPHRGQRPLEVPHSPFADAVP
ncbi:hypothetical protein [Nonomuraea sp. NPDC049309]|uniref:hypothetical protein n=1 Tax=Nonomuraea sp. NPDC049309 TaxID=3364350 RepID=UPI003711EE0C